MSDTLTARLMAEIERREKRANWRTKYGDDSGVSTELAYLAALRGVVELVATWTHEVVDDCWYTCAAATREHDGGETCSDARRGGACDCGLDTRRSQVLAIIAEGLGVKA